MPSLRRLSAWLLLLVSLCSLVESLALTRRDADFESVRTRLHKDHSGKAGDPKDKYFHESTFHPHYDGRFADGQLSYEAKRKGLSLMVQTYLATMIDIGVETWLMHGSLVGWWWNQKVLPWDSDIDVQVSEGTMHFLAQYYNMTTYHYDSPDLPDGRSYMLEINPNYTNRERDDRLNVIDARWVDMDTGLFIDITTVRRNLTHEFEGVMSCKDGHDFYESDLFPLRESVFEEMPVRVPFAYIEIITQEYGEKALTKTTYEHHRWNEDNRVWEPMQLVHNRPSRPGRNGRPVLARPHG